MIHKNYVDGQWVAGHAVFQSINPSDTNDVVGKFHEASLDDVVSAASAARRSQPAWAHSGIALRHEVLRRAGDLIEARRESLGNLLAREEGKSLPESIGEVMRAAQIFQFFAAETLRLAGEILPSVRPGVSVEVTREPIGVIGIITPWNFPIAIPAWKIAPALAYGNAVVFKPAELVPAMAQALVEILIEAGLPAGVLNLVQGPGSVVGQAMLESRDIDAITFTGSQQTGAHIAARCAATGKKAQLEMGGKNPLVVLDDADLDTAVNCAINGAFYSTGQRCTASSRLIVTPGIRDRFLAAMVERMQHLVVGDARQPGTHIGPLASAAQLEKNLQYIAIGKQEGARLLWGGDALVLAQPGYYLQPTLFDGGQPSMRIVAEEIFGPVAVIQNAHDYEHALALANDTPFGLASGICTQSLSRATHFKQNAQAGMVMVNLPTAGVDFHVPFGGRKGSSQGAREQGRYAAEFYTTVKTAYQHA